MQLWSPVASCGLSFDILLYVFAGLISPGRTIPISFLVAIGWFSLVAQVATTGNSWNFCGCVLLKRKLRVHDLDTVEAQYHYRWMILQEDPC